MSVALVTGGTRGIGAAVADRLLHEGWQVVIAARTPPLPLREADGGSGSPEARTGLPSGSGPASSLLRAPSPHHPSARGEGESGPEFLPCDVADADAVQALFATIRDRFGRLDALVTCAGIAGANRLDGDDTLWHAIVGSNLHGTYHCCKAALPLLPDQTGRIVTLASVLGLRGVPDQTAYCAAKHGVVGFTRALALALAPRGITVNALCPGWVDTDMARQRFEELGLTPDQAGAGLPTGRIISPAEVADTVAWLLRPETRSITGHALPLDGGGLALP